MSFRKKIFLFIVLILCIILFLKSREIKLHSKSAIVMDINSGKIMLNKNMNERLKPASMTKLMAMLLIFEKIEEGVISYDEKIIVSDNAVKTIASKAGLKAGEHLSIDTLLKSVFIPSGSDAVIALGEHVFGSEINFVDAMNKKALELSLTNTQFKNCMGLDQEGHFSSAHDMAIIARELVIKFPIVYQYTSLSSDILIHEDGSETYMKNTNDMLRFDGVDGLKTGSSPASGYGLTFTYNKNSKHLIFVVMSSVDIQLRRIDCETLLSAFK